MLILSASGFCPPASSRDFRCFGSKPFESTIRYDLTLLDQLTVSRWVSASSVALLQDVEDLMVQKNQEREEARTWTTVIMPGGGTCAVQSNA